MKKRFLLGALIAVVSSVLFAGTALAQVPNVVYPRGDSDPRALTITEWEILPDGSVHFSGGTTAPNGYSAGIIKAGENGEPIVVTFDNQADLNAYLTARGQEPLPSISGPNYTAPSIPSANALGTYNTSYTGPGGVYNWPSLRNRTHPRWGIERLSAYRSFRLQLYL